MKKVLFLYSAASYGGMITNLNYIFKNIKSIEPVIACIEPEEHAIKLDLPDGVKCHYLGVDRRFSLQLIPAILNIVKNNQIDSLSCHGYKSNFYGFFCKLFRPKLVTITILHGWVAKTPLLVFYQRLDSILIRFFSIIIVLSNVQKERLERLLVSPKKIHLIHNGIDTDSYFNQIEEIRNHEALEKKDKFIIGSCVRLSHEKDCITILRAIKCLHNYDIFYLLVGTGPLEKRLQQQAKLLKIEHQIQFVGYQQDVKPYLAQFNCYVTASLSEGMPNSILEAMASKIPVIASDIPAHKEMISHDHSGLLFETKNYIQLAERIKVIIKNQTKSSDLVNNAYEHVRINYSLSKRIKLLENVYAK